MQKTTKLGQLVSPAVIAARKKQPVKVRVRQVTEEELRCRPYRSVIFF